jgi:hypothetical protein
VKARAAVLVPLARRRSLRRTGRLFSLAYSANQPYTLAVWKNGLAMTFLTAYAATPLPTAESLAQVGLKPL